VLTGFSGRRYEGQLRLSLGAPQEAPNRFEVVNSERTGISRFPDVGECCERAREHPGFREDLEQPFRQACNLSIASERKERLGHVQPDQRCERQPAEPLELCLDVLQTRDRIGMPASWRNIRAMPHSAATRSVAGPISRKIDSAR